MKQIQYLLMALVMTFVMTGCLDKAVKAVDDTNSAAVGATNKTTDKVSDKSDETKNSAMGKDCCNQTKKLMTEIDACCAKNVGKKAADMDGCCKGGMTADSKSDCCKKTVATMAKIPDCCQKSIAVLLRPDQSASLSCESKR